ncbi:hypothetical protein BDP55DRAFT_637111 [Colletotrichum godetiae]|uniref:Uncharacterized protein n=1 Tax=Colletotrichum godetiae TaxID=1209918 RepID=A0AAJ0ACR7_9PEZI|nr:uncharacterized protein BDP55DRAFT_637111 [Colletotrichum godetiae]KAK1659227.1 hypothetical protein BDP55DRAFT_637111 [Colletotrichum godetiae]
MAQTGEGRRSRLWTIHTHPHASWTWLTPTPSSPPRPLSARPPPDPCRKLGVRYGTASRSGVAAAAAACSLSSVLYLLLCPTSVDITGKAPLRPLGVGPLSFLGVHHLEETDPRRPPGPKCQQQASHGRRTHVPPVCKMWWSLVSASVSLSLSLLTRA